MNLRSPGIPRSWLAPLGALILGICALTPGPGQAAVATGESPGVSLPFASDLDGNAVDPLAPGGSNVVVLVFVGIQCPISNRFAPELQRLQERFAQGSVSFWMVYADPDNSVSEIREHMNSYRYPGQPVRDRLQVLVRRTGATLTPECAVFNRSRQMIYHGRINNRFVDFGKARPAATQHDLEDAIAAGLAGKKPAHSHQPAIGCHIPRLP